MPGLLGQARRAVGALGVLLVGMLLVGALPDRALRAQAPDGPAPGACELRFAATRVTTGAELYGRPALAQAALAPGVRREIRVTHGGGTALNRYTLRLTEGEAGVRGELFAFWPTAGIHVVTDGHPDCQRHFDAQDAWLAGLVAEDERARRGCAPARRAGVFEVCRARLAPGPDWRRVLAQLDSLGAWTLPDPATLRKPDRLVLDGTTVAVEWRDRAAYGRYAYYAPHAQPGAEARRAAAILDLMLRVLEYRGAPEP